MLLLESKRKFVRKLIKSRALRIRYYIFYSLLAIICGICFGKKIPWGKQAQIFDALRQFGILILAVIGAWLAVLLPFSIEKDDKLEKFFNFSKKLFPALSYAIYLLVIGILVPIVAEIIKSYSPFTELVISVFRCIGMIFIFAGVFFLLYGFSMILSSFDALKSDIEKLKNAKEVKKKIGPQNKI